MKKKTKIKKLKYYHVSYFFETLNVKTDFWHGSKRYYSHQVGSMSHATDLLKIKALQNRIQAHHGAIGVVILSIFELTKEEFEATEE